MPVTFAPPQPFSEPISAGFGATEQWNATFPHLASLAEAYGQSQQRAAIAQAQMETQASAQTAENQTRANLATAEHDAHAQALQAQFQQQRAMQAEQIHAHQQGQVFDWAMKDREVGQTEMLRAQRMQAGLDQLEADVASGVITKEEAADSAYQLRTNIDRTQTRVHSEQAKHQKAIADMEVEQTTRRKIVQMKSQELSAKTLDERMKTVTLPDGSDVTFYQKGVDHNGEPIHEIVPSSKMDTEAKRAEVVMKHHESQAKSYDLDVKRWDEMYAKEQARVERVMKDQEKREGAIPADELHDKVMANLARRGISPPGPPPALPGAAKGGTPPATGTTGAGDGPPAPADTAPEKVASRFDDRIKEVQKRADLPVTVSGSVIAAYTRLKEIATKYPDGGSDAVKDEARKLADFVRRFTPGQGAGPQPPAPQNTGPGLGRRLGLPGFYRPGGRDVGAFGGIAGAALDGQ